MKFFVVKVTAAPWSKPLAVVSFLAYLAVGMGLGALIIANGLEWGAWADLPV